MGLQHSQFYASAGSKPKRFFAAFGITSKGTANSLTAIDGTQARGAIATKNNKLGHKNLLLNISKTKKWLEQAQNKNGKTFAKFLIVLRQNKKF